MSQRLRFQSLINQYRVEAVLGQCASDASGLANLMKWATAFQNRAANQGRWWGSTQLAQFCVQASCGQACIVLPREVAVVEAASLNGTPVNVQNMWGQFIRPHVPSACGGCDSGFTCRCGCGCGVPQLQDDGLVPTFGVTAAGDTIRFYPAQAADVGKKIVVQGNDANGIWVRSVIDGVVQDGEQVTLALPFAETVNTWAVGAPTAVYKEVTAYRVLAFATDADDNERQIADYQPDETDPAYRRMRLVGAWSRRSCGGADSTLRAIVSLQALPITGLNDWLLFTNGTAYLDGMLSEKHRESGDLAMADALFFGQPRPARNARGVLRNAVGSGAIAQLESELRKITGDVTSVRVQRSGLSLVGFV